jgi:hypothetical protein
MAIVMEAGQHGSLVTTLGYPVCLLEPLEGAPEVEQTRWYREYKRTPEWVETL